MEKNDWEKKINEVDAKADGFKKAFKDVWTLKWDKSDDEYSDFYWCILKRPSRTQMSAIARLIDRDIISANEYILKECWVAGDDEMRNDDEVFFGISASLGNLITFRVGEIKKN